MTFFAGIFPDSALPSPHTSSSTLNLWSIDSYNYYISSSSFTITFFSLSQHIAIKQALLTHILTAHGHTPSP